MSVLRMGKQNISRVIGISVFLEKALGIKKWSFHVMIICCSLSRNAFHWPWGPSIFHPDWSTTRMPECSSGTEGRVEGCLIVLLYVSVFMCSQEINKKRWKNKETKRSSRLPLSCLCACSSAAAGLFLSLSPIRDHRTYHDGSAYIYQQKTGKKRTQTHLCVQKSTPLKLRGV